MEKRKDPFFVASKKFKNFPFEKRNTDMGNDGEKKFKGKEKGNRQDFRNKRQDNFNKNRNGIDNTDNGSDKPESNTKKPFDKKTYRLKKYSNKYKLEQWEEQRKKKLLRNYYKEVQNDDSGAGSYKPKTFDEDETDSQEVGRFVRHPDLIEKDESVNENEHKKKKDPLQRAKERLNKVKQEKLDKKQEIEKAKEEKAQKLQEYKKKKQDRFKKLSKKNKKGQPIMTGRLELLLEKIQKRS